MRILFPLPSSDFDPTESSIPWRTLVDAGHQVTFATPDGQPAHADDRILTGRGFALWKIFLQARFHARMLYGQMETCQAFQHPISYNELNANDYDGILLTGGHAPGMKTYLESKQVQRVIVDHMRAGKPVGAICHGVLAAARARDPETRRSVLYGKKSTCLLESQELTAWAMTAAWLGSYYRTYHQTVQHEVTQALESPQDFVAGPFSILRESPDNPKVGFAIRDQNYVSARYFVDSYRFADLFLAVVNEHAPLPGVSGVELQTADQP
jgi:protease I